MGWNCCLRRYSGGTAPRWRRCVLDCGGTMVAHCCDGLLTACNDVEVDMEADASDEKRYQQLADERPEEGGDHGPQQGCITASLFAFRH